MCEVEPSDQMNRCASGRRFSKSIDCESNILQVNEREYPRLSQSIAAIAIPRPTDNATVRFISPGMLLGKWASIKISSGLKERWQTSRTNADL